MLTAKDVRELLKDNIVEVEFIKANGEMRRMFCTLINEFLPSKAEHICIESNSSDVVTCWDLEENSWRSFKVENIVSLEAEPLED